MLGAKLGLFQQVLWWSPCGGNSGSPSGWEIKRPAEADFKNRFLLGCIKEEVISINSLCAGGVCRRKGANLAWSGKGNDDLPQAESQG